METKKIKPELNGVAETMLLTFYARAQYSKSNKHAFYDAKAVELVERLDYDFSSASKDVAMGGGTIARTLVCWYEIFFKSIQMLWSSILHADWILVFIGWILAFVLGITWTYQKPLLFVTPSFRNRAESLQLAARY